MAANPITDQYAASALRDVHPHGCADPACALDEAVAEITSTLRADLPGLDSAVIGEVALHAIAIINALFIREINRHGAWSAHNIGLNLVGIAAARLYSPEPVGGLPPVDGGETR